MSASSYHFEHDSNEKNQCISLVGSFSKSGKMTVFDNMILMVFAEHLFSYLLPVASMTSLRNWCTLEKK